MKSKFFSYVLLVFAVTSVITIHQSCRKSTAESTKIIQVDSAYKEFVEGFTTGYVSTESGVVVRLNFDVADSTMINQEADATLFQFSPDLKGKAYWIDSRTIKFQPEEKLKPNTNYEVSFRLSKLVQVPDSMKTMVFGFHTISQDFEVVLDGSRAYSAQSAEKEKLMGFVMTADAESLEKIKPVISATQNGKNLPVSWSQDEQKRKHSFTVDSIARGKKESTVQISFNGKSIGVDKKGNLSHKVYALDDFTLTKIVTKRMPEQVIIASFSDPLKEDQELTGKISMGSFFNYSYVIDFNELYIYPASEVDFDNQEHISFASGIQNAQGKTLGKVHSQLVKFQDLLPNVRFASPGVILPSGNGLIIPFEAVNLKAVDVKITKIFQNNIPQFLQENELSGKYSLSRVGRTVLKKTIPLGQVANPNKWNKYFLDISELIKTEPGAIYSVELSIRRHHAILECEDFDSSQDELYSSYNQVSDDSDDNWEYGSYYYDDYYYYDWYEREDPCSHSYYSGKKVTTNILASDIGLMAKSGEDNELYVFASNLISAQPMKDVKIEVLNYQLQTVASGTTDSKGMCKINAGRNPYLVIASSGKQQSYLKMSSGNSLSLSSFDVSGEVVQRGLKGFIYGERGVWRPGDSLFVTLILEDSKKTLPQGHPVTFELYNPLGNLIEKRAVTESVNGFYAFHTATSPDAPTGVYRVIARIGKNTFVQNLRVEAIKPNRLRIDADAGTKLISATKPAEFSIESQWLHGAVAKSLKVECDASFKSMKTSFPKYKGFAFDDPAKFFVSDQSNIFSGRLDENGKVTFKPQMKISDAPGFVSANIETRVYEPGGEFSIDFMQVNISPFSSYVGIKKPASSDDNPYLYTERVYNFNIVNVDENGKLAASDKVKLEVFKLEWSYWWSGYDNSDSEFMYSLKSAPVVSTEIAMKNGAGNYAMSVKNNDWGRYFIRVKDLQSGHSTGLVVFFDWYGYNRFAENDKTAAAMLSMSTNKTKYTVGEEITLSFKAPEGSRAYISIENGSGIIETHQINERDNAIEFKTKATESMAPNVYFSVSLIQPHANTVDGLPIRLYGVVPIFVDNPATILKPTIVAPAVMRPGQSTNITVAEANGKPMTYTLAIVDEGLLSLTKFKTPNPHARFYAREALGVRTWDIYNDVIGAWGGQIQRVLSIGGGDDVEVDATGQRANRFKPMVRFIGPIELGKGKSNTHKIDIPDYVGNVRIMVVAGQDRAYGNAEKNVPVKNPLMLLGTAPRVIGPGESFSLPLAVFAMEDHVKNVNITIQTNKIFSVAGGNSRSMTFAKTGEQMTAFNIQVADAIGVGQIMITAQSGNEKAVWKVEMDVRPANPMMTDVIEATVKEGETWEHEFASVGINGTNDNVLEVSAFIPMNVDKWLTYLLKYPHGCTEQTISGAFPMLYADKLADSDESTAKQAETKVKFAISRMQNLQLASGGIAMWPGSNYPDDWTTSYAGHFAIEAQQKGYVVSKQFVKKWKSFQQKKVRNWKHDRSLYNNDLMQAYRLYTLALSGAPEAGAMNRLAETSYLSTQARWLLASAYVISGRTDAAKRLIAKSSPQVMNYNEYAYTYGSHTRDKAFIMEAYLRMGMNNNALDVLKEIGADLSSSHWLSTQTAAHSLRALSIYLSYFPMGKQMKFNVQHNLAKGDYETKNMTHTLKLGSALKDKVEVKNTGSSTLYVRIIRKGVPREDVVPPSQNNLDMKVSYFGMDGKAINPESIVQGTVFFSEITITHPGTLNAYNSMALTQIFPSGWEVMNDRFAFDYSSNGTYTYQDIRDDRVLTYFDLPKGKSVKIKVRLSASFVGKYYMPMVYCEAMYNNRVNASVSGKWVKVVDPDSNSSSDAPTQE